MSDFIDCPRCRATITRMEKVNHVCGIRSEPRKAPKPAPAADTQQSASSAQGELDCGDNSCYFAKNKTGMRTNHGCRCFDKAGLRTRSTVAAAIEMLPKYLAMQAQLTQLRAELEVSQKLTDLAIKNYDSADAERSALRSDLALALEALEKIFNSGCSATDMELWEIAREARNRLTKKEGKS